MFVRVFRYFVSGGSQPVPISRREAGVITVGVNWEAMLWLFACPKIRPNIQGSKAMAERSQPCIQKYCSIADEC